MAQRLSRRLVVRAFVETLASGKQSPRALSRSLAAYLIETKQTKTLDLVLADIARELIKYGNATADVASAHTLSAEVADDIKRLVKQQTGARHVDLNQTIDERLMGGLQLSFNGQELDASVRSKLNRLQAKQ